MHYCAKINILKIIKFLFEIQHFKIEFGSSVKKKKSHFVKLMIIIILVDIFVFNVQSFVNYDFINFTKM